MRKITTILILLLLFVPLDRADAASGRYTVIETYDPLGLIGGATYHAPGVEQPHDVLRFTVHNGENVRKWVVTSHTGNWSQGTRKEFPNTHGLKSYGLTCNTNYTSELYNLNGDLLASQRLTVTGLVNPSCDSDAENGNGQGDLPPQCDVCECLAGVKDAINAGNGKLDQIIDKIPPAPNWQEVANTMRDTIVPQLVGDTRDMLDDLLGRAPAPPPPPPQPQAPPDIETPNTDAMPDAPSVDLPPESNDNNFDASDVIENAPVIPYEEPDEADEGFNLSLDPLQNLENPGSPGTPVEQADPGSPGVPKQEIEAPPKPDTPEYNPGSPGTPNQDIGAPGTPNDGNISPSNPGDNIGAPPGNYNPS